MPELLRANRERLTFTLDADDLADCPFLFVCVDTPPTRSGDADLSRVWSVVDQLPELSGRAILVMKSTVPVGTGEKIRHGLDERGLDNIGYVSNPEFLAEGSAVRDFMNPDRIAIGAFEEEDGDAVAELYATLEAPIVRCDVNSAEMIKLAVERRADDADLVHQRDRERVRGDRGGRRRRSPRGSGTTSGSGRISCAPGSATAAAASPRTRSL